jgi:hypothetical protein
VTSAEDYPPLNGIHPCAYVGSNVRVYYLSREGTLQVADFLNSNDVTQSEYDRIFSTFALMDTNPGTFRDYRKFKKLLDYRGKPLMEVKKERIRIGCWFAGAGYQLLLGYACFKDGEWEEGDLKQLRHSFDYYVSISGGKA